MALPRYAFYEILGVSKDATQKEICKAYRLKALILHPDKRPHDDRQAAQLEFHGLQKAYETLKDPAKKSRYDLHGHDPDESGDGFEDFLARYTSGIRRVTVEDIERFEQEYKGSAEEEEDLIEHYTRFKGDIRNILEYIPLSDVVEIPRYLEIYERLIKLKRLKKTQLFGKACEKLLKKTQRAKRESKARPPTDLTSLQLAIQNNQKKRNSPTQFIARLEAKYAKRS